MAIKHILIRHLLSARTPEMEAVDGVCPPPGSRNISHYASLSLSQKAWQAYGMNIGLNPKTQAMAEDIVQRLDPLNKTKITKPASRLATEIWVEKRLLHADNHVHEPHHNSTAAIDTVYAPEGSHYAGSITTWGKYLIRKTANGGMQSRVMFCVA